MYISWNELPKQARVWIYQANRIFSDQEAAILQAKLLDFTQNWDSHQKPLKASFQILHNRFILMSVDESYNQASGCSIDKSVHFLQNLEQELGLNLFDRTQIAYKTAQEIQTTPMAQIKSKIAEGAITPQTLIFNNLVNNIADWEEKWEVSAQESWVARFL